MKVVDWRPDALVALARMTTRPIGKWASDFERGLLNQTMMGLLAGVPEGVRWLHDSADEAWESLWVAGLVADPVIPRAFLSLRRRACPVCEAPCDGAAHHIHNALPGVCLCDAACAMCSEVVFVERPALRAEVLAFAALGVEGAAQAQELAFELARRLAEAGDAAPARAVFRVDPSAVDWSAANDRYPRWWPVWARYFLTADTVQDFNERERELEERGSCPSPWWQARADFWPGDARRNPYAPAAELLRLGCAVREVSAGGDVTLALPPVGADLLAPYWWREEATST